MSITINNNSPRAQYSASSGQTNFAGTWRIENASDIKVYQTLSGIAPDDPADILVLTTDYTITGVGVGNSFIVVLNVGAATGDVISILDEIDFSATYNFLTNQDFDPIVFNEIFSKFDRELKQLRMETRKLQPKYQNSEQVIAKDYKLPQLAANQSWRMDETNTEIEAVVLGIVGPGETWYGVTTGVNTYLTTITDFTGYTTGEIIFLQFGSSNTSASTININGLGGKTLVNTNGIAFVSGDLDAGVTYTFIFHDNKYYLLGLGQKATVAEADGGTDNFKYITPLTLTDRLSKVIPSGVMIPFGGVSSPAEWLLCDGSEVSRATYADLFAAIGTQWGSAGPTTFTLPGLRGRDVIGAGNGPGLTGRVVGQLGGEEDHALTANENGTHDHSYQGYLNNNPGTTGGASAEVPTPKTTGSSGLGTPHNTMQPFGVGLWIIKI